MFENVSDLETDSRSSGAALRTTDLTGRGEDGGALSNNGDDDDADEPDLVRAPESNLIEP